MPLPRYPMLALPLLCLSTFAVPEQARAQDAGPYVSAHLGLTGQRDQTLRFDSGGGALRAGSAYDNGFISGAAFGYRFATGWRVEGEFSYQTVELSDPPFAATAGPQGTGNYASTSVAANLLYGWDLGATPAQAYVGAGAVRLTEVDIDFESDGAERSYSGSDNGLQVLAGVQYELGERWLLDLGLRYLRAGGLRLDSENGSGERIEADYAPWAITLGVGWRF